MRAARLSAILSVVFLASGVSVTQAGEISSASFVDNGAPGCVNSVANGNICDTNDVTFSTPSPNNDNINDPEASDNQINLTENFTAVDYIDVLFKVSSTAAKPDPDSTVGDPLVTEYLTGTIVVNNNTGATWSEFTWSLMLVDTTGHAAGPSPSGDGLDFDFESGQPKPTADPAHFTDLDHQEDTINWSGGVGVCGDCPNNFITFDFSIDVAETPTEFILRGSPTAAAVPEPASLLLLGAGLAGLGLWRRWHA